MSKTFVCSSDSVTVCEKNASLYCDTLLKSNFSSHASTDSFQELCKDAILKAPDHSSTCKKTRKRNAENIHCSLTIPNGSSSGPCDFEGHTGAKRVFTEGGSDSSPDSPEVMDFSDSSSVADSGIDCSKYSPVHISDIASSCFLEDEMVQEVKNDILSTNIPLSEAKSAKIKVSKKSKSPVFKSLFKNSPAMIHFACKNEQVTLLPEDIRVSLKWKLSSITPLVIKQTVTKVGFTIVDAETTDDWMGTWGKHLRCNIFRRINPFEKVNHYPGGFHLGRKDRFLTNYNRMLSKYGPEDFDFFPETYLLPADLKVLKQKWRTQTENCWIIKPCASARGTGVKVVHKWSQVPKTKPFIIQRYVSYPYLINGSKFDLRIYVMVSNVEPLRIYLYDDGLVRFASEKYSLSNNSFANRFVHLTNYSINKKSASYTSNDDQNVCQGHKWSLKSFWSYMSTSGVDVEKIQETITDMIIKTVVSVESPMCRMLKTYAKSAYNCFELFGFDIMLDKDLHPWLLEVNISPSLHTKSTLDSNIKGPMVRDMLNIAGFEVPSQTTDSSGTSRCLSFKHKQLRNPPLTSKEKRKHAMYTYKDTDLGTDILDHLTHDDVRCLIESEDELCRRGNFDRIFPTPDTDKYFSFFDHQRYYNVLLHAWERTMHGNRTPGIQRLQELCVNLPPQNFNETSTEDTSKSTDINTEPEKQREPVEN